MNRLMKHEPPDNIIFYNRILVLRLTKKIVTFAITNDMQYTIVITHVQLGTIIIKILLQVTNNISLKLNFWSSRYRSTSTSKTTRASSTLDKTNNLQLNNLIFELQIQVYYKLILQQYKKY